jgi:hypothetical protein
MYIVAELKIPEHIRNKEISEEEYIVQEFEQLKDYFSKVDIIAGSYNDPTTELGISDLLQASHGGDQNILSEKEIKNACDLIHAYMLSRNGYIKHEDVSLFKNEGITFKQLLTRKNK